jgi:hypothetical protein
MPYAFVGGASNAANSNTFNYSPTAGSLIVLASLTSAGGGNPQITSVVTIGGGAVSLAVGNPATADSNGIWHGDAWLKNCPAGVTGFTVTYNGGTPGTCRLSCVEYSGIDTAAPLVCTPSLNFQTAPGTGTDALSTAATSITAQPALTLGIFMSDGADNISAGTGEVGDFISADNFRYASKRATSTGSKTLTATAVSVGTGFFTAHFLAFQEPASGAAATQGLVPQPGPGIGPFTPTQFSSFGYTIQLPPPATPPLQIGYRAVPGPGIGPSKINVFMTGMPINTGGALQPSGPSVEWPFRGMGYRRGLWFYW